jgi:import inner membrane translocase subunit TIM54
MKQTRPLIPPNSSSFDELQDSTVTSQSLDQHGGDLDFDKEAESYFKSSLSSTATDIEDAREKYYAALPAKLETARALSRGTREPTKDEVSHPPPTEVELRAERMKKELRWRGDLDGWELIRRDKGVVWDERFAPSMKVFVDPPGKGEGAVFHDKSI